MKRSVKIAGFCAGIICLNFFSVFSQSTRLGVRGGINLSQMETKTPAPDQGGITAYSAAATFDQFIYNFLYIQSELSLSQKGWVRTDGKFLTKRTYAYLEIPIMAKGLLKPGRGETELYLSMGPTIGYILYGRESTDDYISFHELIFVKDKYRKTEFGLAAAVGATFSIGFGFLTVEGRYSYGLTSPEKNDFSPKSRVIGLSVGYAFYQGRKGLRHRRY